MHSPNFSQRSCCCVSLTITHSKCEQVFSTAFSVEDIVVCPFPPAGTFSLYPGASAQPRRDDHNTSSRSAFMRDIHRMAHTFLAKVAMPLVGGLFCLQLANVGSNGTYPIVTAISFTDPTGCAGIGIVTGFSFSVTDFTPFPTPSGFSTLIL